MQVPIGLPIRTNFLRKSSNKANDDHQYDSGDAMLILIAVFAGVVLVGIGVLQDNVMLTVGGLILAILAALGMALPWLRGKINFSMLRLRTSGKNRASDRTSSGTGTESSVGVSDAASHDSDPSGPTHGEDRLVPDPAVSKPPLAGDGATSRDKSSEALALAGGHASLVRVIEGRKRYHLPECSLLKAHESDILTLEEALEEGFSACSQCAKIVPPRDPDPQ